MKPHAIRRSGQVLAAVLCAAGLPMASARQAASQPPAPEQVDYFKALQLSKAGAGMVLNLDLPRSFLERPAGRALRFALRGKFRYVKPDTKAAADLPTPAPLPSWASARNSELPAATLETWKAWKATVPLQRGFRAPLFNIEEAFAADRTLSAPVGERAKSYIEGQGIVSERLARDGLIPTTMIVISKIKRPWVAGETLNLGELKWCGIPADLLDCFTIEGEPASVHITSWIKKGAPEAAIPAAARGAVFSYRPTSPGFELPSLDGTDEVGMLRFQISGDAGFRAPGDGGPVDVIRQMASVLPAAPIWVSVDQSSLERVKGTLGAALKDVSRTGPLTIVGSPLSLSPWAQDNAVVGRAGLAASNGKPVTLLPRFASINEQSSQFIPGDSLVFETLSGKDTPFGQMQHSRLLFQGGNMMVIREPATGNRILLIGEAEVYRVRALGLSGDQAASALAVEFGAQRVHILPATSFHIDMELSIRRVGDSLVACVNDEKAASLLIFKAGADALAKAGVLKTDHHERIVKAVETGDKAELGVAVSLMWDTIGANVDPDGYVGEKFKTLLTGETGDRGAGAVERLLLAMDQIDATNLADDQLVTRTNEEWFRRYIFSLRGRVTERADFIKDFGKVGVKVVRVPSTSEDNLSTNYLNGIHTKDAYLMPAFGGVYASVDEAAAKAIGEAFGVKVVPVLCGRVQERYGGLHCMTGIYPAGK